MATSFLQVADNAISRLATSDALNNTTSPITVPLTASDGAKFPLPGNGFQATIWNDSIYVEPGDDPNMEKAVCTARTGDSITLTRAAPKVHTGTPRIALEQTSRAISDLNTAVNVLETDLGATPPALVTPGSSPANKEALFGMVLQQLLNIEGGTHWYDAPAITLATLNTVSANVTALLSASQIGWIDTGESWAYASATTITVPSDATLKHSVGDKIRLVQLGITKYFSIIGVTSTVLTITGGLSYVLTGDPITAPFHSRSENPLGFPHWFTYNDNPVYTGTTPPSSENLGYQQARFRVSGHTVYFHNYHVFGGAGTAITQISYSPPVTIGGFPPGTTGQIAACSGRVGGVLSSSYINGQVGVLVTEFASSNPAQFGISGFYEI